jgi:uncharacterized protein YbjT (DUF2867 family)
MIIPAPRRVLLTGVSGYVGGRLLRRLEPESVALRCISRRPERLAVGPHVEVLAGDVLDRSSVDRALEGVHTACYLVHSMESRGDYRELDRRGALNFAAAARAAGVTQIVYLGGLGAEEELSRHLSSRHEVGRLLRSTGVPTLELRASIVIGPGSASFETVRELVDRLPVIVAPHWVETLAQPVSIDEVLGYLLGAIALPRPLDEIVEVGGTDQLTYAEVMREYARQRGLHRRVVRPPLTPRASRTLLRALTPRYGRVAAAMVDSLRNETIVRDSSNDSGFAVTKRSVSWAISHALAEEDHEFAAKRWSVEPGAEEPPRWGGTAVGHRLVASRTVRVCGDAERVFSSIERIGGETGWYGVDLFWRLRGALDAARGGVGLRRGRPSRPQLRIGDEVDFWRVERLDSERLLCLTAEMKLPGRLWLQFEVEPAGPAANVRQTTIFDPAGLVGLLYWYLLYPIHRWVFARLLAGIAAAIEVPVRS